MPFSIGPDGLLLEACQMDSPPPSEINAKSISVVIACGTAILLGPGPIVAGGASVLLAAIAQDFGWKRTTFSILPLITGSMTTLLFPFLGRLMDRCGVRRILLPGIVAFSGALMGLALVPKVQWAFFAIYVLLGAACASQGPTGFFKVFCQWFVRSRGAAIALVSAVSAGGGYALMPQVANYLVVHHGWRSTYFCLSLAILLISFPINYAFLRERRSPGSGVGTGADATSPVEGVTQAQGLRAFSFWKLWFVLFLAAAVFYGVMIHLFSMLLDRGIGREAAATTMSALAIGAIVGQLSAAYLLDRVNTPKVGIPFFASGLAGVLFIHLGNSVPMSAAGAMMIGVGQGAELSVLAYIVSRLFGLRAYGGLCGIIYAAAGLATGMGPMLFGFCFDRFGSYQVALLAGEGGLLIALLLVVTLPPYAFGTKTKHASAIRESELSLQTQRANLDQ
jgi:MFS family permease